MGVVYLAEHTLVGRQAAIKVLLPELSVSKDVVARFFNEARAMGAISDPGIVQMYDFGFHTDGCAYIVMELLEGEPLSRRLKRLKRFAPIDALRIVRQVAGSLGAAHAAGSPRYWARCSARRRTCLPSNAAASARSTRAATSTRSAA
jgi:serine/threonine protein kinase